MPLTEEEKFYISKIYRHGVNHLIDDSIPNRIICVHNLHWCVENLLRKATYDWTNIDYRDGFEEIFKKFYNDKRISVSNTLIKSIENLNKIRNDMEHRSLYHDMTDITSLIPEVAKFISWIVKNIFHTSIDLFSISGADEEKILQDFNKWKELKLREFDRKDAKHSIFILLIPSTYSPNLIDLNIDGINELGSSKLFSGVTIAGRNPNHESEIEKYFRCFRHLFSNPAQVYSIPLYMRYFNERTGNEMRVFPDGRIYSCFRFRSNVRSDLGFNMELLYSGTGTSYIINKEYIKTYELPLIKYSPLKLDHIFSLICYCFHPKCKNQIVKAPTEYHRVFIILPRMKIDGYARILDRYQDEDHWFETERIFCGDNDEIVFKKTFKFDDIVECFQEFKNWTYSFFRNPSDTGFS